MTASWGILIWFFFFFSKKILLILSCFVVGKNILNKVLGITSSASLQEKNDLYWSFLYPSQNDCGHFKAATSHLGCSQFLAVSCLVFWFHVKCLFSLIVIFSSLRDWSIVKRQESTAHLCTSLSHSTSRSRWCVTEILVDFCFGFS